jgi:hypothetical protein
MEYQLALSNGFDDYLLVFSIYDTQLLRITDEKVVHTIRQYNQKSISSTRNYPLA